MKYTKEERARIITNIGEQAMNESLMTVAERFWFAEMLIAAAERFLPVAEEA